MDIERQAEAGVVELAYALGLPLVATNEPFFPAADDFEAHDALLAIAEGRLLSSDDRRRLTPEHHFASRARDDAAFRRPAGGAGEQRRDRASAAGRGRRFRHRSCRASPPRRPTPRRRSGRRPPSFAGRRRPVSTSAFARRPRRPGRPRRPIGNGSPSSSSIIERMKYPGYFLIVADFIKWAKGQGIPVGPGRGSGAGSVVAWALTITDLDPLRFGLLFERFLNPERVSMPDFDIDFCQDRRDEVIDYVAAPLRRGSRRADHHLRHAAGARRAARCRSRPGNALRPGRPALQDGARRPRQPGDACAGGRRRAALRRGAGGGAGGRPAPRHRDEAGGALPARLDACRRHRHRRPSARRTRAALPRSAVRRCR